MQNFRILSGSSFQQVKSAVLELPRFIYTDPTGLNEDKVDRLEDCLLDADVVVVTETHRKNDSHGYP